MGNVILGWLTSVIQRLIYTAPVLIVSITVHEFAHAKTAEWLGDPTARYQGRVSLNPLRHLDPVGSIFMLLFGFGWGRPVPVASLNFKKPKRDNAIVALAGPVSNLLLACVWGLLYGALYFPLKGISYLVTLLQMSVIYNCMLCVFNLLPLPPLDGSRILALILPPKAYAGWLRIERWSFLIVLALLWLGILDPVITFLSGGLTAGIEASFVRLGNLIWQAFAGI